MADESLLAEKVKVIAVQNDCTIHCTNDVEQISVQFYHRQDGYQRISQLDVKFRNDSDVSAEVK